MKRYLLPVLALIMAGCGGGSGTTTVTYPDDYKVVDVFTLGPVRNALVKDANNQVAVFDENTSKYIFPNFITFPVTVEPTALTYIDVDYDGVKSANDLLPKFTQLKSFNRKINLLTNIYYSGNYSDQNITEADFISMVKNKFSVDVDNYPEDDENYAKTVFGAYNYFVRNGIPVSLEDIDDSVDKVNVFFTMYLQRDDINDSVKYYSMYDALVNLDARFVQRADSLHKPEIKIVRNPITNYVFNSSVDVFDTVLKDGYIYAASGHEELAQFLDGESAISYITKSDGNILSFGKSLYSELYGNRNCLFLNDSKVGVKTFDITNNTLEYTALIQKYRYSSRDGVGEYNITNDSIQDVNGYISAQQSKRLLLITTLDKGFYLINMNSAFNDCNLTRELNASTDFLVSPEFDGDIAGKSIYSSAIRKDGTYIYVSSDDAIYGYDSSILDRNNIISSKTAFVTEGTQKAYNLLLVNNDNELFVSTDKGIQIYDVDNNNNINFISEYPSEGARVGYMPKMDFYDNYLFFTDGYKGVKVVKYDSSFQPMLCGVAYFAPRNNSEELAKVNSVKYKNGNLYIGVDSYGIVKIKLNDVLFEHCK